MSLETRYSLTLHGSNTLFARDSDGYVTKTDVTGAIDVVSFTHDFLFLDENPQIEGDEFNTPGGLSITSNISRDIYEIQLADVDLSEWRDFQNIIKPVVAMQYNYLEVVDFAYTVQPAGFVIPLAIMSIATATANGRKRVSLSSKQIFFKSKSRKEG